MTRFWGHTTYAPAARSAIDSGVKKLMLFHHDPDRTDDDLDKQVRYCRETIRSVGGDIDCCAASEGMEIDL